MAYESGHNIVKENPLGWMFVGIVVVAIIISAMIMFGFYHTRPGYHPSWAPDGCRIIMESQFGPRIFILVSDTEKFDTEAECAQVILDALLFEDDFYRDQAGTRRGIPRIVELQLPGYGSFDEEFSIQYYEVRTDDFNFNTLRVINGPVRYFNDQIELSELRQVANGERMLGFLETLPDN